LRKLPEIAYVEPNYITKLASFTQVNPGPGLDRLDQRNLPLNNEFNYAYAGEGVHVYILDTGIDTTSGEWAGRIGEGVSCTQLRSPYIYGPPYEDTYNHGTAVASVAAGTTFGIAKFATLHSVRISRTTDGTSTTAETECGINWVAGHGIRPAVANMSFGGYPNAFSTRDAINNLILTYNISFVKAAGNDNTNAYLDRANRATNEFVVGAMDPRNDTYASFSNYAVAGEPSVNFIAPGVSVLAADRFPGPGRLVSGTSFAAPYVAGVIAQYLNYDPSASSQAVYDAMNTHFNTWGVVQGLTGAKAATPNRLLYSVQWCVPTC
jgi:subtilisin family serine protease